MSGLGPPDAHPIYCGSMRTVAILDRVLNIWKCQRCGKKVKVAW